MDRPADKFILMAPNATTTILTCRAFLHFTTVTKCMLKQDGNNRNCLTGRFQNLEQLVFQRQARTHVNKNIFDETWKVLLNLKFKFLCYSFSMH